jgi:hypothetical protein
MMLLQRRGRVVKKDRRVREEQKAGKKDGSRASRIADNGIEDGGDA